MFRGVASSSALPSLVFGRLAQVPLFSYSVKAGVFCVVTHNVVEVSGAGGRTIALASLFADPIIRFSVGSRTLLCAVAHGVSCGCSSVGRAQRCQRCCRGFESHHPLFLHFSASLQSSSVRWSKRRTSMSSTDNDPDDIDPDEGPEVAEARKARKAPRSRNFRLR